MPISHARARAVVPPKTGDLAVKVEARNTRIVGKFGEEQVSLQTTISLEDLKRAAGRNAKIASVELGPPWNVGDAKLKVSQRGDSLNLSLDHGVNQAAVRQRPPELVVKLTDGRTVLVTAKIEDVAVKLTGERRATVAQRLESLSTEVRALRADLSTQTDPAAKKRLSGTLQEKLRETKKVERELQQLDRKPDAQKWSADTRYDDDQFGG